MPQRDSLAQPAAHAAAPPPRTLLDGLAPRGTVTRTVADGTVFLLFVLLFFALLGIIWAMLHRAIFYIRHLRFVAAPRPIKSLGIGSSGLSVVYDEINDEQDKQLVALSRRLDAIYAKHDLLSTRMDAVTEAAAEEAGLQPEQGESPEEDVDA
jgi:hypothetical protein